MSAPAPASVLGITIAASEQAASVEHGLRSDLERLGLGDRVEISFERAPAPSRAGDPAAAPEAAQGAPIVRARLSAKAFAQLTPGFDTLDIGPRLGLDIHARDADLDLEIAVAMLAAPQAFHFPSVDEWVSAVRLRRYTAQAARRTTLAFDTEAAERPAEYWHYDEDHGFLLNPGVDLIEALERTTQPEHSGRLYSFSCYRATEYVIQLALARELRVVNPPLYQRLCEQCRREAIRSGRFHDVFLYEHGSMDHPLPTRYYVAGDRLWFRNPDERSADVAGFEGSWVFYHGHAQFTNFWKRSTAFSFTAKCLEIHHWRDGAVPDASGELMMDESIVEARVQQTLRDPAAVDRVLERMVRLRDPRGVYAQGGCIDSTRESLRWVRPGTADIRL